MLILQDLIQIMDLQSSPWKTLAYACSRVKTSGDIIHLNAGTFIETAQSSLAVGVSIEGEGVATVIQSRVGGTSFTISVKQFSSGYQWESAYFQLKNGWK